MGEYNSTQPVQGKAQLEPQESELKQIVSNMRNAVEHSFGFLESLDVYANALSPIPPTGSEKSDQPPTQGGATGALWEILGNMNRIQNRLQYLNDHFYKVIGS
jgi:hypothetical protein